MKHIHFIGIGGIGMSGLAEIALNLSFSVSGSDLVESKITKRLKALGARIYKGHSPKNLGKSDTVIVSSAIPKDNVELLEAERRKLSIFKRGELLAFFMKKKEGIAISGAHGKTTTTSLIGTILDRAGLYPTVINGGIVKAFGSNARLGAGKYLICEADESDGSFTFLFPKIAVITNMDKEHMEYFKDLKRMEEEYLLFIKRADFAVLCEDNWLIRRILPRIETKYKTYGIRQGSVRAKNIRILSDHTEFDFMDERLKINLLGRHNVLNSLAAICVCQYLSVSFNTIKEALENFKGVERRLDIKRDNEIMVIEDYGHHPTEIRETIKTVKKAFKRKLIVIFQPHRYTRTKFLLNRFASCFNLADTLILTEIYPAFEEPLPGISGEFLYFAVKRSHPSTFYLPDFTKIPKFVENIVQKGDILLVLGAGNINKIVEPLCRLF